MPRQAEQEVQDWAPVVGRTLAFLCLHYADMQSASVLEQAEFLERFGLSRKDAARLLGSSERSINELARQRKNRGARKSTAKRSTGSRTGRSRDR